MKCSTCRKSEATHKVWNAGWIAAHIPPLQVCKSCCTLHEKVGCVTNGLAMECYQKVKQFVSWLNPVFDQIQNEILLNGDILKGRETYSEFKSLTVQSRLLASYKEDYWVVTKYSLVNLGLDTFWCSRLEFR